MSSNQKMFRGMSVPNTVGNPDRSYLDRRKEQIAHHRMNQILHFDQPHQVSETEDSSTYEASPRTSHRCVSEVLAPHLEQPVAHSARDSQGYLHQWVTKDRFPVLAKILKKHLKEGGDYFLNTDNYFSGPFFSPDAPSQFQEAWRDVDRTLGQGYDPKERGENCAMYRKILTQPKFLSYSSLGEPKLYLETLRKASSSKSASDVINGKYPHCLAITDPAVIGARAKKPPIKETILSPLASLSPECNASFMTIKKMLYFAPHLLFLNLYILPDEEEMITTTQWV